MRAPEINNQQKAGSLSTEESERFYSRIENMNLCDHLDAVRYAIALMLSTPIPPPNWKEGVDVHTTYNKGYMLNDYIHPDPTIPPHLR